MTAPITNTPALDAEKVRRALAAAGYCAARVGFSSEFGTATLATSGYVVTEGDATHGPRVEWDQRLSDDEMEAKLEALSNALERAGMQVWWEEDVWALRVSLPVTT